MIGERIIVRVIGGEEIIIGAIGSQATRIIYLPVPFDRVVCTFKYFQPPTVKNKEVEIGISFGIKFIIVILAIIVWSEDIWNEKGAGINSNLYAHGIRGIVTSIIEIGGN